MQLEHVSLPFEIKRAPASETDMTFSGYASVFNVIDAHGDMIMPGAFTESIASAKKTGRWPAMLMQHGGWGVLADDLNPIGIWTDLQEDEIGLATAGKLIDTARGLDAYKLMKSQPRPAIDGLSIGFMVKDIDRNHKPSAEGPRRKITKIDLVEISPVTFPANQLAQIQSVKAAGLVKNPREFEQALCDALPLSRRQAKALMAGGFKSLSGVRDEREGAPEEDPDDVREEHAGLSAAAVAEAEKLMAAFKTH